MGALDIIFTLFYIPYAYMEAAFRLIVPHRPKSIQGQIALVTGGGKGIGKATALQLAAKGATVILWDVDEESTSSTLKELQADKKAAYAYTCDISNAEEVRKVAAQVRKDVGEVDILVNNAGICWFKRILDLTESEIRKTIDVNLLAHHWTIKEFLPMMIKQNKGNIVNVASLSALVSFDFTAGYGASKYGVRGMTENLERELRNQGLDNIKVTSVYPSLTNTALVKDLLQGAEHLAVRMMEPSEVAEAIVNGIQRDLREVFVPGSAWALWLLKRALPSKAFLAVVDCLK